jgi:hypothetical protein
MEEAIALKTALEQRGKSVFLCAVEIGDDNAEAVIAALSQAKLAVILGTKTYGEKTASSFSTYQELRYIIEQKKPFYLVKMCDRFVHQQTLLWLPDTVSYYPWQPKSAAERQGVPADLVDKIVQKLAETGGSVAEPLAATTAGAAAPAVSAHSTAALTPAAASTAPNLEDELNNQP